MFAVIVLLTFVAGVFSGMVYQKGITKDVIQVTMPDIYLEKNKSTKKTTE